MNKAFVKDDGTWQDPEIELDPRADIPAGSHQPADPRRIGRSGDAIKVRTPPGGQELEIVEVCYREINYSFFLALTVSSL